MHRNRQNLIKFDEEVYEIVRNEVISKKKSTTPVTKLISFIDQHIPLTNSLRKYMETHLSDLVIDNSVIFIIF